MVAQMWQVAKGDLAYFSIHHQMPNRAMKDTLVVKVDPDIQARSKYFGLSRSDHGPAPFRRLDTRVCWHS